MLCVERNDIVSISAMTDAARYPTSMTIATVLQSPIDTCCALFPSFGVGTCLINRHKRDGVFHALARVGLVIPTFIVLSIFEHEE